MRRFLPIVAMAALMTASLLRPTQAQVLFDNFGPGNVYNSGIGWRLDFSFTQGEAFTPSVSAPLASIEAAINLVRGREPNELTLKLMTDDGGKPGSVIEEWFLSGAMGVFGDAYPTVTVTSALNPLLSAGTQYWVVAFISFPTEAAWNLNSVGDIGPHTISRDGGVEWGVFDDQVRGAFRVVGVPEPGTLALLIGAGSAGSLFLIRRRRR